MKGYKRPKGAGKKIEVGTKLYPRQIEYLDAVAASMGMTRYKLIEWGLDKVFGIGRYIK